MPLSRRDAPCGHGLVGQHGRVAALDGQTVIRELVDKRRPDVLDRRERVEVGMSDVLLDYFLLQVEEATLDSGDRLPVLGEVACESLQLRALVGGVDDDGAIAVDGLQETRKELRPGIASTLKEQLGMLEVAILEQDVI